MKLSDLNSEEMVEVNGIELCFRVSMISNVEYNENQEKCLLEAYYDFLNQSKINGFMDQYIKMSVERVLCIFENDDLEAPYFRFIKDPV